MTLEEQIAQITNHQEFTRLCNLIHTAIYPDAFQVIDGTRADSGNDGYVRSESRILAYYCPTKPEQRTDANFSAKARGDFAKALTIRDSGELPVEAWTFITPRKLPHHLIAELRAEARTNGVEFSHLESTYLSKALLDHPHLIKEFPFLHVSQLEEIIREALAKLPQSQPLPAANPADLAADQAAPRRAPRIPGLGSDPAGSARVAQLRSKICTQDEKAELRAIAYGSTDPTTQVNAITTLCNAYMPADDNANDLLILCEFGQRLVEPFGDVAVKGFLIAMVGSLVSFQHSLLDLQLWASDQADKAIGLNLTPIAERTRNLNRLSELKERYTAAFTTALELTRRENSVGGYAGVLVLLANAAGQRASYMRGVSENEAANAELSVCKSALLSARTLYAAIGDNHNATNALFNLAHQIHYHGEINEAKELNRKVMQLAEEHGDHVLLQKAKWLKENLDGKPIPKYEKGERRQVDNSETK